MLYQPSTLDQKEYIHSAEDEEIKELYSDEDEEGDKDSILVENRRRNGVKQCLKRPKPKKLYPSYVLPGYEMGCKSTTPCRIRIRYGRTYQLLVRYHTESYLQVLSLWPASRRQIRPAPCVCITEGNRVLFLFFLSHPRAARRT